MQQEKYQHSSENVPSARLMLLCDCFACLAAECIANESHDFKISCKTRNCVSSARVSFCIRILNEVRFLCNRFDARKISIRVPLLLNCVIDSRKEIPDQMCPYSIIIFKKKIGLTVPSPSNGSEKCRIYMAHMAEFLSGQESKSHKFVSRLTSAAKSAIMSIGLPNRNI